MMYAKLTTEIDDKEFDALYVSSESYLVGGNFSADTFTNIEGTTFIVQNEVLRGSLKALLRAEYDRGLTAPPSERVCVFELREITTDKIICLKVGRLDVSGTFKTRISLLQPDSRGSLSWLYEPPSNDKVVKIMENTGIKRMLMRPVGANLENFIIAIGGIRVNDSSSGVKQYKSTWGWDGYETDLVEM